MEIPAEKRAEKKIEPARNGRLSEVWNSFLAPSFVPEISVRITLTLRRPMKVFFICRRMRGKTTRENSVRLQVNRIFPLKRKRSVAVFFKGLSREMA